MMIVIYMFSPLLDQPESGLTPEEDAEQSSTFLKEDPFWKA